MGRFERIVRPVVLPDIRPAPPRPVRGTQDDERGVCVLGGASGRLIDLSISEQSSFTRSKTKETKRRFDEVRVKKKDANGTVDEDTFVDVEVVNKVWMKNGDGTTDTRRYADAQERDNIEILRRNVTRTNE